VPLGGQARWAWQRNDGGDQCCRCLSAPLGHNPATRCLPNDRSVIVISLIALTKPEDCSLKEYNERLVGLISRNGTVGD